MDAERTQSFIAQYENLTEFFNFGAEILAVEVLHPGVDSDNEQVKEIVRKCKELYIEKKSKEEVFELDGGISTINFGSMQIMVDQNRKIFRIIIQEEFPIEEPLSLIHGARGKSIDYDSFVSGRKIPIALLDEPSDIVGLMYIDAVFNMSYFDFVCQYPEQAHGVLNSCKGLEPEAIFVLTFHYVQV